MGANQSKQISSQDQGVELTNISHNQSFPDEIFVIYYPYTDQFALININEKHKNLNVCDLYDPQCITHVCMFPYSIACDEVSFDKWFNEYCISIDQYSSQWGVGSILLPWWQRSNEFEQSIKID